MLFCHHQASLTSHAEACHLLWPLLVPTLLLHTCTSIVQARTGHRQSIFMAKGHDEEPKQLVQAMLRPSRYLLVQATCHCCMYTCLSAVPNQLRQSFVCSLAFSRTLLSVSSRIQTMPSPCACIYPARLTTTPSYAPCPRCQSAKLLFLRPRRWEFYEQSTHNRSPKVAVHGTLRRLRELHTTMHTHMLWLAPRLLPEVILATSQSCTGTRREGRTHHPSPLIMASHYVRVQPSPPTAKNL